MKRIFLCVLREFWFELAGAAVTTPGVLLTVPRWLFPLPAELLPRGCLFTVLFVLVGLAIVFAIEQCLLHVHLSAGCVVWPTILLLFFLGIFVFPPWFSSIESTWKDINTPDDVYSRLYYQVEPLVFAGGNSSIIIVVVLVIRSLRKNVFLKKDEAC